jgi:predicted phosphoribosyltransferase
MGLSGPFSDRREAGAALAGLLGQYAAVDPVVVGLPRGGVVVAFEVAEALGCQLDVIIAGKMRAPENPELAIGAVTEGGEVYLNRKTASLLRVTDEYIEQEKAERMKLVVERLARYRSIKEKVPLKDRTVILVDDGIATGSTMIAAIQAAHAEGAKKIIVAVPGGPEDTLGVISAMDEVAEVVCISAPAVFYAVSQLYLDFSQVEDDDVVELLRRSI